MVTINGYKGRILGHLGKLDEKNTKIVILVAVVVAAAITVNILLIVNTFKHLCIYHSSQK